jgi:hypothetical protein
VSVAPVSFVVRDLILALKNAVLVFMFLNTLRMLSKLAFAAFAVVQKAPN